MFEVDGVQVLEAVDLAEFIQAFTDAQILWNQVTAEYVKENGDGGTCVLGAGIEIAYIPKQNKSLRGLKALKVCHQPHCCQGSINWEGERLEQVMELLRRRGIKNPKYNPGWMD
jgi:hypothetical protein